MKIPPSVNIVFLVVVSTLFYTMVGQMVPQKEVPAPEVIEIDKNISTEEMIDIGKEIARGKGICLTCHTIGRSGALRYPDLEGIGSRAATRIPELSGLEYMAQSLYEPDIFIIEGFNPGMPKINKAPIGLTDDEILTVLAYLQSLGGTPSVTMATKHSYNGGGEDSVSEEADSLVQESTASAQQMATLNGETLFESYGCLPCHPVSPLASGETVPPHSLHDIGSRRDRDAILAGILGIDSSSAEGKEKREAMEKAGVYSKATLQEILAIVEFLASRAGLE